MRGQIVGMVVEPDKVNAPGVGMECAAGQDGLETDVTVIWEKTEKDMSAQKNLRVAMVRVSSINSFK